MYNDMQLEQYEQFRKPRSVNAQHGETTTVNLATLLARTFNSSSNEEVQAAEKTLEMLTTYPDFIDKLAQLLHDPTQKADVKEAAVNYVNRHTQRIVSGRNQVKINEAAKDLNRILGRDDILLKYRRRIVVALRHLLAMDNKNIVRAAYSDNLSRCLAQVVTRQPVLGQYQYCVLFGAAILAFPKYDQIYENMAEKSFSNMCIMGNFIMKQLSLRAQQSLDWLEVLDDLMSLLGLFFLREGWNTHPTLFNTYCSQSILQLLDTIFSCVSLGNGYYITNFGKTHYSIYNKNQVFASAVDIAKKIYENLLLTSRQSQLLPIVQKYLDSFYKQIKNLLKAPRSMTIKEHLSKTPSGRCQLSTISSIITFMSSMNNILALEEFYSKFSQKFINQIVIPFLEFGPEDISLFVVEPDMAIGMYIPLLSNGSIDTVQQGRKDQSGFIPQEVLVQLSIGQLLNNIARNSHGWLPNIVNEVIQVLIEESLPINKRYPWIMILAMLSKEICQRAGDAQLVRHYFLKEMRKKHSQYSEMQVAETTLLLIMVSRFGKIFRKNPVFSRQVISWTMTLIDGVTVSQNADRCLTLASVQCIQTVLRVLDSSILPKTMIALTSHLLSKKDPPLKALEIIQQIFREQNVMSLIYGRQTNQFDQSSDESEQYHDIPQRMQEQHLQTIKPIDYRQVAIQVIRNCVRRILKQQASIKTSHDIVQKCWHIIRQIMENRDREVATSQWVIHCFHEIKPLYQFLSSEKDTDYDNQVLRLQCNFLKKQQRLEDPTKQFFQAVPRLFCHQGYLTEAMFQFLVYFIKYGEHQIKQSPNVLNVLITVSLQGMLVRIDSKDAHQGHVCQAVLLLQDITMLFANQISKQTWQLIIQSLLKRLTKHQFIKYTFLKSHIVCCLAICLLNNPNIMTAQVYDNVFSAMITQVGCFDQQYPIKLYVISGCQIIKKFPSQKMFKLFRSIFCTLAISYNRERNKIQLKEAGQDIVEIPETEEETYNNALKILNSHIRDMDEFEYFAKTADWLATNYAALFKFFQSNLITSDREYLNLVVSVRKVKTVPRKIVKLRR